MLINASALAIPLKDRSIHAIVTSPPYFGLRVYADKQEINWPDGVYSPCTGTPLCITISEKRCSLGLESNVEEYIWHILLVLRECRRVLRDDGVLWVNIGDTYSNDHLSKTTKIESGNLIGIPHRLMLAAQADGWIIRNDCVWHKPSPVPESIRGWRWIRHKIKSGKIRASWLNSFQEHNKTNQAEEHSSNGNHIDNCPGCKTCNQNYGFILRRGSWRHTRCHEFIFQLTKRMTYYSDSDVIKEISISGDERKPYIPNQVGRKTEKVDRVEHRNRTDTGAGLFRNPRSVITISSSQYKGGHPATFPSNLIRRLVLSSVPLKCCPSCGTGWSPQIDGNETIYIPSCRCKVKEYLPGILLDPFCGSGTSGEVARECGIRFIGIDLSFKYLNEQAMWRAERRICLNNMDNMPLFADLNE